MKVVDANILIYAVNRDSPRHVEARSWIDTAINEGETVGLPWLVLLAFIRLTTKAGLFAAPLSTAAAIDRVRAWLAHPTVVVPAPTDRHLDVLAGLLSEVGIGGNFTSDAHLAALAVEHGAEIVTFDHDFGRFAGVRWSEPRGA